MHTTTSDRLLDPETYAGDKLNCDVIMKGGITSGVTYPWAVCEIATAYRLNNVGGSSAGAIAAAAAAAAELGRITKPNSPQAGFPRLAELPTRLAGTPAGSKDSTLFNLFQPQDGTKPFFRLLKAGLNAKGKAKFPKVLLALVSSFWPWAILGALPGLAVVGLLLTVLLQHPALRASLLVVAVFAFVLLVGVLVAAIGAIGGAALLAVLRGLKRLPENDFGMCSGFAPAAGPTNPQPCESSDQQRAPDGRCVPKPLTTWLADELDGLAGKNAEDAPLTLGDLSKKGIELKMFTTNLTDGSPYTIPFKATDEFYFDRKQFDARFPPRVVDWMVRHADRSDGPLPPPPSIGDRSGDLHRLPPCEHFPVIVAARMSLSFPILLSAVPMWAIDVETNKWAQCWFSDGGITSNFPIHFFDGPIPGWPTFGLNLGPFDPEQSPDPYNEENNIDFPLNESGGMRARHRKIGKLTEFGQAILDTMQNWSDNGQTRLPGYRDRIIVVRHTRAEGGLNLNMSADGIMAFSERGRWAGQRFVERFGGAKSAIPGDQLSWDNHRWIRYRSFMELLEQAMERLRRAYGASPEPSALAYANLIQTPPTSTRSPWADAPQRDEAAKLTGAIMELAEAWLDLQIGSEPGARKPQCTPPGISGYERGHPFAANAPTPRPVLRVNPDF